MNNKFILLFLVLASLLFSQTASALTDYKKETDPQQYSDEYETAGIPKILDPNYRFQKKGRFEFAPYFSSYLGQVLMQTWFAGTRLYYNVNNSVAIGANYGIGRLYVGPSSDFGKDLRSKMFHVIDAEATFSNDVVLRQGKSLVQLDLFMSIGMGAMRINTIWEPTGVVGGGVKVYPGLDWLAVRIDVTNYIHPTPRPQNPTIDCDVVFMFGASFFFPKKPI